MCGIAALFGGNLSPKRAKALVDRMNLSARHRGPDGEGGALFFRGKRAPFLFGEGENRSPSPPSGELLLAFGHRRLSVLDLSPAAAQPLSSRCGRYWVVYNGELYNYLEIREELEREGVAFFSDGDTEVLLNAYLFWGIDALQRFNGMFAFLLYDLFEERLFAARDRFGVKPLYYWSSPAGYSVFASEIGQIATLPEWRAKLDHQGAYDFLNWSLTDHREETLFSGVKQLKGGHYLFLSPGEKLEPRPWYQLKRRALSLSYEEAQEQFATLFFDAVRLRLRSDIEVGCSLSGGIDSSSIAVAAHLLREGEGGTLPLKSFSSTAKESAFNESHYIEEVVRGRALKPYYIYSDGESLIAQLDEVTKKQGEPFASTSIYAQWRLFAAAKKKGVQVLLGGQGADEALAGYNSFYGYRLRELLFQLQPLQLLREAMAIKATHPHHTPWLQLAYRLLPPFLQSSLDGLYGRASPLPSWIDRKRCRATFSHPFVGLSSRDLADWSQTLLLHANLPMLLRYEERNSMAHSIEARTPFLDYRLVEFSLNLPSHYKIERGVTKRILRDTLQPHLPPLVAKRRDKMAFVTPESCWMERNPLLFKSLVRRAIDLSGGLLKESLLDLSTPVIEGKKAFHHLPWRAISFGRWLEVMEVAVD